MTATNLGPGTQESLVPQQFAPAAPIAPQDPQPTAAAEASAWSPEVLSRVYREAESRRAQERRQQAISALRATAGDDPEREARAQRLARELDTDRRSLPEDLDAVEQRLQEQEIADEEFEVRYPGLMRRLSDVQFVRLVRDDLGNLKKTVDTFDWWSRNYEAGAVVNEKGAIGLRQAFGTATAFDHDRLAEIRSIEEGASREQGWLATALQVFAQQVEPTKNALLSGAASAAAGAALGPKGAGVGFGKGFTTAYVAQSVATNAGIQYLDMLDQGFTEEEARVGAAIYGLGAGALDAVGMKLVAKPFASAAKALQGRLKGQVAAGLTQQTVKSAAKAFAAEYLVAVGGEAATEAMQDALAVAVEEGIRRATGNPDVTEQTWGDALQQASESFVQAAKAMSILGLPGPAIHYMASRKSMERSAAQKVMLDKVVKAAEQSKLRERNPDAYAEVVDEAAAEAGVSQTYIDGQKFAQVLEQLEVSREDLEQVVPGLSAKIDEAVATGDDVVISTGDFAAKLAQTPVGQALLPEVRIDQMADSAAETAAMKKSAPQRLAEAQQAIEERAAADKAAGDELRAIETGLRQQLLAAGRLPKETAYNATLYSAFVATQSRRMGMSPAKWHEQYGVTVVGEAAAGEAVAGRTLQQGEAEPAPPSVQQPEGAAPSPDRSVDPVGEPVARDGGATVAAAQPAPAQAAPARAEPGTLSAPGRGQYRTDTYQILLRQHADASTFLHELAHHWLNILGDIAAGPNAPESIQQDMQALLKWFGVPDLAAWKALPFEQMQRHQEKFAYSIEAWLFEGNAPSVDLQGVFSRVAAWIRSVYKHARDRLNVIFRNEFGTDLPALTADVRMVFDRMLAAEDEIAEMRAAQGMAPMFETQAQSGLSDIEWQQYQQARQAAEQSATDELSQKSVKELQWLSGAKARLLTEMRKRHRAVRAQVEEQVRQQVADEPIYRALRESGAVAVVKEELAAQREQARAELEAEVAAEPVYRARRFLRHGETVAADGQVTKTDGKHRIDRAKAKELAPPDADLRKLGVAKTSLLEADGLDPAEVASQFGFADGAALVRALLEARPLAEEVEARLQAMPSAEEVTLQRLTEELQASDASADVLASQFGFEGGQALVRALLATKPLAEEVAARTDQRMLIEHSELADPKKREEAVLGALHNEHRTRLVAIELRALEKSNQPLRLIVRAARVAAQSAIEQKPIGDIDVRRANLARRRAERAAWLAARSGDRAEAARAKRRQILEEELVTATQKARREVDDAIDGFEKLWGGEKVIAKTRSWEIVLAARAILTKVGLGPKDAQLGVDQGLARLQAYNPELYAKVQELMLRAEGFRGDYTRMTLGEFRVMQETVEGFWFLAHRDHVTELNGKKVAVEDIAAQGAARLEQLGVELKQKPRASAPTKTEVDKQEIMQVGASHRRVEHLMDQLDGGKPGVFTGLWRRVREAANQFRHDRKTWVQRYEALVKRVGLEEGTIECTAAGEIKYTFGAGNSGSGMAELLGAMLHMGNDSNLRKLLIPKEWGQEIERGGKTMLDASPWENTIAARIKDGRLQKKHFDFLQGVWDLLEELKPQLQRAHYELFGYYFKEVEARPISTPWGVYRGGYVPALADNFLESSARLHEKDLQAEFQKSLPITPRGFTKERTDVTRHLVMDIRKISGHLDAVLKFVHMQPAVNDVRRVIDHPTMRSALNAYDPTVRENVLDPWLQRSARQVTTLPGHNRMTDRWWTELRSNVGLAVMAGNVSNALQNLASLFPAMLVVRPRQLMTSLLGYLGRPRETAAEVTAKSIYMEHRLENQIHDLRDSIEDVVVRPSKLQTVRRFARKYGYVLQKATQNIVEISTWTAAYNQALEQLGPAAEQEAVRRADSAVSRVHGDQNPESVSAFEVGDARWRAMTQFMGFFVNWAGFMRAEYGKVVQDLQLKGKPGKVGRLAHITLMGWILPMTVAAWISKEMAGKDLEDDDGDGLTDEYATWLLGANVKPVFAAHGVLGQFTTFSWDLYMDDDAWNDRMPVMPVISVAERGGKAIKRVFAGAEEGEVSSAAVRDVLTLIAAVTGVPLNVPWRPAGYAIDVEKGDVEPTGGLDYVRGLLTGRASDASR